MAVFSAADAEVFDLHGARFASYVRPSRGGTQLCAWRTEIGAGVPGTAHTVSHDEVLAVLDGDATVHIDDDHRGVGAGDVVLVPAGARFRVDGGTRALTAWVTTSAGFHAVTDDGRELRPPWTV